MQFGSVFQRLLWKIFQAEQKKGPVFLMKGDIVDSFYRGCLRVQGLARTRLVVPLDNRDGKPLIPLPLADQMGWAELSPFFTALSDTPADLGNAYIKVGVHPRPHSYDLVADTNRNPSPVSTWRPMQLQRQVPNNPPVEYIDVYPDNFIELAQGSLHRRNRIRSLLFYALEQNF